METGAFKKNTQKHHKNSRYDLTSALTVHGMFMREVPMPNLRANHSFVSAVFSESEGMSLNNFITSKLFPYISFYPLFDSLITQKSFIDRSCAFGLKCPCVCIIFFSP